MLVVVAYHFFQLLKEKMDEEEVRVAVLDQTFDAANDLKNCGKMSAAAPDRKG